MRVMPQVCLQYDAGAGPDARGGRMVRQGLSLEPANESVDLKAIFEV